MPAGRGGIDSGGIPAHHLRAGDAEAQALAVAPRHHDLIAGADVLEKGEMGVAMGRVDGGAVVAGVGGALHMAGTEGERLAAATGQVSAQDHGLTAAPVAMLAAKARSNRTWASIALAWM